MKKSLLWVVVLVLSISMVVAFSLAGCKATTTAETTAAETTAAETTAAETTAAETTAAGTTAVVVKKATLTVMIMDPNVTPGVEARFAALEEKTGIKSEIELIPGGAEGQTIIKSRIASGEMPDILYFNTGALLNTLNPEKNFVDISNEPFVANLSADFKTAASVNGKLFGIPVAPANVGGIVYNKKIYNDLGLKIPTTWAQFLDNCDKAKTAGYTAVLGTYADSWTAQLPMLADFYNVNAVLPDFAANYTANKAHFADTPDALKGFQKIADLKDLMNKDFATTTYDTGLGILGEGKAVHYPMLSSLFRNLIATYPDVAKNDLGIFPLPSDNPNINGFTFWTPSGYFITKSCKDLESAKVWMAFLTSQEGYDAFATAELISGPLAIKGLTMPSNALIQVSEIQKYIDEGKSAPALEFLSPIKGPNLPQICVEVGSGMKTAAQGAADYDKDVKKQAQQLDIVGW